MKLQFFMLATRMWCAAGALLLCTCPTFAQAVDPEPIESSGLPLDDITTREVVPDRHMLEYQPVREADILWETRIGRIIDVREKVNLPFSYPEAPLAQILGTAALSGTLKVYDPGDDRFSQMLSASDLRNTLYRKDSIRIVDVDTGEERVRVVEQTPDWSGVRRFRIKEAWFFDSRTGTLRNRILGIAPLFNVTSSEGDFLYERPLFWVHYPSARPFLARQKAFLHGGNMAATTTWEDLFEMRYFASTVYKENNLYDRRIEDYLTGVDALFEASKINEALFNHEQDLWSW